MKSIKFFSTFFIIIFNSFFLNAQSFYDLNTIQQINVHFNQPDWDYRMDTAKVGEEGYILAEWVEINGQIFDSVGVKYKGNSSYDSTYFKNPLHISLDEFIDQAYQGYTDIKLGNEYSDPSMIREALGYKILQNYMDCPQSNFAEVYINDSLIGLFSNDESISKKFCSDHFSSSKNTFVKCNPSITSAAFRSNLKYINADSSSYQIRYDLQSDIGWNELVALCDSLSNNPSSFSNVVDVDRVMWMLAFNNVLVNLDSYSGAFAQNHYVYKDNTGHYNPVVWDLNMCFGGFSFAGSQGVGMGTLDTLGMQNLSVTLHAAESDWPLINNVINNPIYKRMYIAHMRTIVDEMFANGSYLADAAQLQGIIDAAVQNEPNPFFTYSQFLNGLTTDVLVSSRYVPGIMNLMSARISYLQSTPEFIAVPPQIDIITVSDTAPAYLGVVTITAEVSNANSNAVYLGTRFDKSEKFSRVLMYDDGAHNDGIAGDQIYGVNITMLSAQAQYYVYAENNDAGIFSPQRAEHEFYFLNADIQIAQAGEVVINEFLAVNQNDTVDENGAHEDWIELFNGTPNPLNLFGLYLSDTYTNLSKFSFPENSVIQPNGYLMIWADEDNTTTGDIHCNFKLSSNGEAILLSNAAGNILDSISFGAQTPDHSTARCPNGTGPFTVVNSPSFEESNHCTDGIEEYITYNGSVSVFPNPANNVVTISSASMCGTYYEILNSVGEIVYSKSFSFITEINTAGWKPGFYIYSCGPVKKKIFVAH
ncbi:hypothetical protein BH11BAC1_BH11BAC1_08870 [soil metagenome]